MKPGFKEDAERAALLRRLTLAENFETAEIDLSIAAATETTIVNPFRLSGRVPRQWIIVDDRGAGFLKKGLADWTSDRLSFRNVSATDAVDATVLLFR